MKQVLISVMMVAAVFWLGVFSGCGNEEVDLAAPLIEVFEPVAGARLPAGEYATFLATFTDNLELGTYNVEIHDSFDEHSHGRMAFVETDPSLLKWYFDESFEIPEGNTIWEVSMTDVIQVPANAIAGPYHFIVQSIDKLGNTTAFDDDSGVEFTVYITNASQPQIQITNLVESTLHLEPGVLFMATGEVVDETTGPYAGMHAIDVVLGPESEEEHHAHGGRVADEDLIDASFEDEQLNSLMIDGKISLEKVFKSIDFIPSQIQIDELTADKVEHLTLKIMVHDEQGNIGVSITPVHF